MRELIGRGIFRVAVAAWAAAGALAGYAQPASAAPCIPLDQVPSLAGTPVEDLTPPGACGEPGGGDGGSHSQPPPSTEPTPAPRPSTRGGAERKHSSRRPSSRAGHRQRRSRSRRPTPHRAGGSQPRAQRTPPTETSHRPAGDRPARFAPSPFVTLPGPSGAMGVPNFVIDRFRVPIFLLPIYQAAGIQYGVPWELLAAINEIETDYGRNLSVSSAGALGWMQFLPSTWRRWGVDANRDGRRDPFNPPDAIFSAARYLKAAGAGRNLRTAVFAYNHAGWYVDSVMKRARTLAGYPPDFVGALTGLSQARFPVAGRARYGNAARAQQGIDIYAKQRAPVVAVSDGVVKRIGHSARRGRYLVLQDVYGNRYTYSRLGSVRRVYRVPKRHAGQRALARLEKGSRLIGGTIVGRVGAASASRPAHIRFEVRPVGRTSPSIDPKPILDGWTLLASTSFYRAPGKDAPGGSSPAIGQVLLMPKALLIRRVLADPRVKIYACGRRDVSTGRIDQRVLATLEYLAELGLDPTVTALECGHGLMTASGNVSEHSTGDAVDIAAINGTPILGHQGPGSITDVAVKRLMQLQGTLAPHQIISLMDFGANTLALPDHADHIHVGFKPRFGDNSLEAQSASILRPGQWQDLVEHLGRLGNPAVRISPSRYALPPQGGE